MIIKEKRKQILMLIIKLNQKKIEIKEIRINIIIKFIVSNFNQRIKKDKMLKYQEIIILINLYLIILNKISLKIK
jgi:hypothetical protein